MSKQITKIKVSNITKARQALKLKLDKIDTDAGNRAFKGYYESRVAIKIAMWKKGKAIDKHFRGVKCTDYPKLSRDIERDFRSIKQWHNLYKSHPKLINYREIAEDEASKWTEKVFIKMKALPKSTTKPKQLPESKFQSHVTAMLNLLEEMELTDKHKKLRRLLEAINK